MNFQQFLLLAKYTEMFIIIMTNIIAGGKNRDISQNKSATTFCV